MYDIINYLFDVLLMLCSIIVFASIKDGLGVCLFVAEKVKKGSVKELESHGGIISRYAILCQSGSILGRSNLVEAKKVCKVFANFTDVYVDGFRVGCKREWFESHRDSLSAWMDDTVGPSAS